MDKNFPRWFIVVLNDWFSNLFSIVRWEGKLSFSFQVLSGVRQGGILSPGLFSIVVDGVLSTLAKTKTGCWLGLQCLNSIMYADDLILLAISISDLQYLTDLCYNEFIKIGLDINFSKTFCIRIGLRHNYRDVNIEIGKHCLKWVDNLKYLGVTILSAKKFLVDIQVIKQNFFRALNSIFGKIGVGGSPVVLNSLIEAYCVPLLLYSAEALEWSEKNLKSLEGAFSQAYFKIFKTFDSSIIAHCQFFLGQLPLKHKLLNRKLTFLSKLINIDNGMVKCLFRRDNELSFLLQDFNINSMHDSLHTINWRKLIWCKFSNTIA